MKTKLLALLLLAGSSIFAAPGLYVGVNVGGYYAPPPPRAVVEYRPVYPGTGYVWVGGYYGWVGGRYAWHSGYWGRPPYYGARWYAPRYYNHRYYSGYWRR